MARKNITAVSVTIGFSKMTASEIKYNLNKPVIYDNSEYILKGAMIRLGDEGYYYQAELLDKCKNSVCRVRLAEIDTK